MKAPSTESNIFKVHCQYDDEAKLGFIEKYTMPSGETIHFISDGTERSNVSNGKIDLLPLKEYIGQTFTLLRNGAEHGVYDLTDVAPNKHGILAIHYEDHPGDIDEQ